MHPSVMEGIDCMHTQAMQHRDNGQVHVISADVGKPLPGLLGLIGVGCEGGAHAPADPDRYAVTYMN